MHHEPSIEERRAAVERILRSESLRRAPKLRELLRFICEQALDNHPEVLKEREIGRAVFGRPERYDPGDDNIVRVQIRNLRARLERYYKREGRDEATVLRIPKGRYVPAYEHRGLAARLTGLTGSSPKTPVLSLNWRIVVLALASVLFGVWIGASFVGGSSSSAASARPAPRAPHAPWAQMFDADKETLLVPADSIFAMCQRLLGRSLSLEDYLNAGVEAEWRARAAVPSRIAGPLAPVMRHITWRQYIDYAEARMITRILDMAGPHKGRLTLRHPRTLHSGDFKGKNVILLGAVRSNPWGRLFESQTNFQFHYEEAPGTFYFHNLDPRAGEAAKYRRGGADGGSDETYALVRYLPALDGDSRILLIAGGDSAATNAASGLLMSEPRTRAMIDELGLEKEGELLSFEVVLKTSRMVEETSHGVEIVAYRVYRREAKPSQDRRAAASSRDGVTR